MPAHGQHGDRQLKRLDAPWLGAEPLLRVFSAFAAAGASVRVVGGAVRNSLLGQPVADVDLATPVLPDQVMALAQAAGLDVYPTGIEYGTVTVVSGDTPFEVTTLRRDVATDGRHALVAFTDDWVADAQRRDFTINALSCDADGTLFDPVGGLDDLDHRRVRFIGEAAQRIREDYLRILRFFRFSAAYGVGPLDASGLAACTSLRHGLNQLSAERVRTEMLKLLATPRAAEVVAIMNDAGILDATLHQPAQPARIARLQQIETQLREPPDVLTRLAALTAVDAASANTLARRLRLSHAEADALTSAVTLLPALPKDFNPHEALYRMGREAFGRAVRLAWAAAPRATGDDDFAALARLANAWSPPEFPLTGEDVLALGVSPGPEVGRLLRAVESDWIDGGFAADRQALLHRLQARAAKS